MSRLLLCAVLVTASAACTGDSDPNVDPPEETSSGPLEEPAGELAVADFGVSADESTVSYGVILENPTAAVAHMSQVVITMVDDQGEEVVEDSSFLSQDVTSVLPDSTVGFGQTFTSADAQDVADLEIEVSTKEWYASDDETWDFAPVEASKVEVATESDEVAVTYQARSQRDAEVKTAYAAAVFHDSDGQIVGGLGATGPQPLPAGTSEGTLPAEYGIPEPADPAGTEVFIVVTQ